MNVWAVQFAGGGADFLLQPRRSVVLSCSGVPTGQQCRRFQTWIIVGSRNSNSLNWFCALLVRVLCSLSTAAINWELGKQTRSDCSSKWRTWSLLLTGGVRHLGIWPNSFTKFTHCVKRNNDEPNMPRIPRCTLFLTEEPTPPPPYTSFCDP